MIFWCVKRLSVVFVVVALLVAPVFAGCVKGKPAYDLGRAFGIEFPTDMQLIYYGKGLQLMTLPSQYAVFKFQTEPTEFLTKYRFDYREVNEETFAYTDYYKKCRVPETYWLTNGGVYLHREFASHYVTASAYYSPEDMTLTFLYHI